MKILSVLLCLFFVLLVNANIEQQACGPRVRRPWRTLTVDEKRTFVDAVVELKTRGIYDNFVRLHYSRFDVDYAHSTSAFFPWHRWYLWHFENGLRALGGRFACLTVPYWDWERDDPRNKANSAIFENGAQLLGSYSPSRNEEGVCVRDGAFRTWTSTTGGCLRRQIDSSVTLLSEAQVMQAITVNRYGDGNENNPGFRSIVENRLHAAPHNFIGGHMGDTTSPNDPIFFLHHSNVDRLWAIWQDCHDYDKINYNAVTQQSYIWYTPTVGTDHVLSTMPFTYDNGNPETVFRVNGRFPSPRDVMLISGNRATGMSYSYDLNDNMVKLLDDRYRRCRWDWFNPAGQQQPPANNPPPQTVVVVPPANPPQAEVPPPAQSSGRTPRPPRTSGRNPPRAGTPRPTGPARTPRPTGGDASNLSPDRQQQLFDILRQFFRSNNRKRSAEQETVGQPVIRKYGDTAKGLIDQVKQRYKVIDARVQLLIDSICDSNPITKFAPIEEKLFMAAVGECALLGTEKHVNPRWLKAMKMENMTKLTNPICPKKSCCNVTEMVSTALLCPGGGIATPVCTDTCVWKYDCEKKTVLETPSVSAQVQSASAPVVSAAWSDDVYSDSEEFSAQAVGDDYLDVSFSSQEEFQDYVAALSEEDQQALGSYFTEVQMNDAAITQENSAYYPEIPNARDPKNTVLPTVLGLVVGLVLMAIVVLIVYVVRMRSTKGVEERN